MSRRRRRLACALRVGLLLVAAALAPAGCSEVEEEKASGYEPARLQAVGGGGELKRVTLTPEGARRTGLRTARVRGNGGRKVVPYAALIYDPKGATYVYTSPSALSYVRAPVKVDRIEGGRVLLSSGPPAGTAVVTVGAAEVYGTELEVGEK